MDKRRLQNNNKCADVPSTRTRQRYASYSDAYEDKTAQHIGSYNSTKFGSFSHHEVFCFFNSFRTGRRTSEHRLHPLLRHGHKTRHGGILNTGTILISGNQKNGKTTSGGRNCKRRGDIDDGGDDVDVDDAITLHRTHACAHFSRSHHSSNAHALAQDV